MMTTATTKLTLVTINGATYAVKAPVKANGQVSLSLAQIAEMAKLSPSACVRLG